MVQEEVSLPPSVSSFYLYNALNVHTFSCCVVNKTDKPRIAELRLLKTGSGDRINVISSLASKWKDFGLLFDFDEDGTELDNIEADHKLEGPRARCQKLFQYWLKGRGKRQPATWEVLITLLKDADEQSLSTQIEEALH